MATDIEVFKGYADLLNLMKSEIKTARIQAALKVNHDLIQLYLRLGTQILIRDEQEGWGSKVIDRLAKDLRQEFPEMKGLSRSNLKYMRAFAAAWQTDEIGQRLVGQLPWGHNITLLKLKNREIRCW